MKSAAILASLALAEGASLKLSYTDCGAAHGKITGLTPDALPLGSKTTATGTGSVDEAVSAGTFEMDLKASIISQTFTGDLCAAKSFSLPLGTGTIQWDGLKCPVAAGAVSVPVDITLSSSLPSALQTVDLKVKGSSSNGDDLLCMDIKTAPATADTVGDLPPTLKQVLDLAKESPEELLEHIRQSPMSAKVRFVQEPPAAASSAALPTVLGHGMGDSCFEAGFSSVTTAVGKRTGTYAKCIPTGGNIITDTIDGFLMNMDKSVDVFAEKIRADPKLAGGFNAIGFSQGNSLIRGYIHKYNDPPVNAFISVHGTVMGVAAFPNCFQQEKPLGLICKAFAEVLGDLAYNSLVQGILFQADYYREASKTAGQAYLTNSQIAQWNNEKTANATYTANFGKVKQFAMVRAMQDSMVYPNEGEHWGSMSDGASGTAQNMTDTKFYKQNLFGLKDANEAGKIAFETTPGDHLQFTDAELYGWLDKYFLEKSESIVV